MQQASCTISRLACAVGCDVVECGRTNGSRLYAGWQLPAAAPGYEETIAFDDDFPVHYERRPIVPNRGMAVHREPPLHDDVRAEVGYHNQFNRQSTACGMKSAALNVHEQRTNKMGSARNVQC